MSRQDIVRLPKPNRGSDVDFSLVWRDSANDPADLSGYTLQLLDVSTEILPYLTATISDPPNGVVSGRIEWDASLLAGVNYRFRIQVTLGTEDDATPLIEVTYR
jgi:hypothetical protein